MLKLAINDCRRFFTIESSMQPFTHSNQRASVKLLVVPGFYRLEAAAPVTCFTPEGRGEFGNTAILYQPRADIASLCLLYFIFRLFLYVFSHLYSPRFECDQR